MSIQTNFTSTMIENVYQEQIVEGSSALHRPRICFLIYTYNRADTLPQAVESVLNQTFRDFELVLINNGSTDNTSEVLKKYVNHPKVRCIQLEKNIGSMRGMNFALDQINGEWYGLIGDDDYLYETAFEEAMRVIDEIDPEINAIAANAVSTATGKLSGLGLHESQYLSLETAIKETSGDFFGLTKTQLLGKDRLNEKLYGDANTLWYKVYSKAKRYYIHKPLMVYNNLPGKTESSRIRTMDLNRRVDSYTALLKEKHYLQVIRDFVPDRFRKRCLRGMLFLKLAGNEQGFLSYRNLLTSNSPGFKEMITLQMISILPRSVLRLFLMSLNFIRIK
ncbi:MAG: glycosyltransferase family 2 protein [Saprospiraceae bacterium]|nr:glycosyltransferase family 2 protein [Saprospiraceae bacterium]